MDIVDGNGKGNLTVDCQSAAFTGQSGTSHIEWLHNIM